ncbi:MAG TPA: YfhO family protein, partial [Candidatus Eisenbacteria bacterium]|nr:YfhO family protein [Candidatus Eisenbacteria bacterium]
RDYAAHSVRSAGAGGGAGFEYATSWSFHPREMLTFVIPSMFGFGGQTYWGAMPFTDYPNYMGIVPFALAVYAAVALRGTMRAFFITLASVSLLISFGKHFAPLYSLLYDHLPFFNKFRVPVMILVLVQFATAALAALGLDRALRLPEAGKKGAAAAAAASAAAAGPWWRACAMSVGGAIGGLVLFQAFRGSMEAAAATSRPNMNPGLARLALDMASIDLLKSGLLLAAALASIALFRAGRIGKGVAAAALLLITAGDLWTLDRRIMDPQLGTKQEYAGYFAESPEVAFFRADSTQYRVLPMEWNDARLASFGVASVLGYHPAKPRLYQAFVDTVGLNSLETLQFLNTKYVVSKDYFPPTMPGLVLRHDGQVKVYEVEGALPRAFMVHRLHPVRDGSMALAVIRSHGFDPHYEALWDKPDPLPVLGDPTLPDRVRTVRFDFNEAEYSVATNAPGLLVTVDQWDPDWSVTIDGKPAALERVNYMMRGVLLPAGVHNVRFRYMPRALEAGIRISAASLALTILLAGIGLVTGRRRRGASAGGASGAPGHDAGPASAPTPPEKRKGRRP